MLQFGSRVVLRVLTSKKESPASARCNFNACVCAVQFCNFSFWKHLCLHSDLPMEIAFLASGDSLIVLEEKDFVGKSAKSLKHALAPHVGVPRFRLRLVAENCSLEFKDDEVFTTSMKTFVVVLDFETLHVKGVTALMRAAKANDLISLENLLSRPSDPDILDVDAEVTALYYAVQNGHVPAAHMLLEARAFVNIGDTACSALSMAASENRCDLLKMLLQARARTHDDFALSFAVDNGNHAATELLLASGFNVNEVDRTGETALTIATAKGDLRMVQFLLESGARCDILTGNGYSVLDIATMKRDLQMMRFLLWHYVRHVRGE